MLCEESSLKICLICIKIMKFIIYSLDAQQNSFTNLPHLKKSIKPKKPATNRRPPSRLQKNSNAFCKPNMAVRINPLIFKQHQNSQQYQINFTKQKQLAFDIMSNINKNEHNFLLSDSETINFEFNQSNQTQNINITNHNVLDTNDFIF